MQYFNYNQEKPTSSVNNISVLSGLNEEEWEMIIFNSHSIDFLADEILLKEGEVDNALYILVSGKVEVLSSSLFGREKILACIEEGSVFGEISFFDNLPRTASIRSLTAGKVLRISHKSFDKIAAWNPKIAQQLLFDLGRLLAYRFRNKAIL
ncbi:MAG: cyclic nucleotide-binding domain-containing protein [Cocleimonas sp.]|nr:cyclic nucleotide-binding domain-containing protein [Cocleimonas sp.]